jgi:hypothetical protein
MPPDRLGRLGLSRAIRRMIDSTMPHAWKERQNLAKAHADIVAGEKRVTEQILLVDELTRDGYDTTEARKLLQNYEKPLLRCGSALAPRRPAAECCPGWRA